MDGEGEDTNLALKIHEAGMKIGYPEKGAVIDLEEKDDKSISLENKVKVVLKEKREKLAYENGCHKEQWDIKSKLQNNKTN